MSFELTILGCNSAIPAHGRFPTAQVLKVDEECYLIDCGEGTQMRMQDYKIRKNKINTIFISHLHGDHIFGLIGLLNSLALSGRTSTLKVFSPPGLEDIINVHIKYTQHKFPYPLVIEVLDTTVSKKIFEDQRIEVFTIPLQHRIPTCGYLFQEKKPSLNIIAETIEKYQIPYEQIRAIKSGADYVLPSGETIPNHELTLPPLRPRSYAFCSDTMYQESIIPIIKEVDLLYHETTFLDHEKELAKETMHSTAREAGIIAKKASVGQLITGHYSSRYKNPMVFVEEAKTVFPNTVLGIEGAVFSVERKRYAQ